MATRTRQNYRLELRKTILDAAREAFAEGGFESISMRKLAERIGCSHGNIYLHFQDKEALFDALVEESFEQLAAALRGLGSGKGDLVRMVRKAARAYVDFGVRNPHAYEFAFLLRRPGPPRKARPHASYGMLRSLVQRCIDEKRFRRMNVDTASQALWAAVHGVTALLVARPDFPWSEREKVIRQVIDSAVDGLLA